ncbi:MAG: hypothetical protein ACKOAG_02555 [Candidatus Kapaibacterium sp.]
MNRLRILFFLLFLVSGFAVCAQEGVTVRDTSLFRGKNILPVDVRLNVSPGDTLSLHLAFDPRLIEMTGVTAGISVCDVRRWSVMRESEMRSVASIEVVLRGGGTADGEILRCGMDVLSGPDTITVIEPLPLRRNGDTVRGLALTPGRVRILNSTPIILQETEYLGPAYPSASRTPVFSFRTTTPSDLTFTVFDAGGHARIVERLAAVPAGRGTYECGSPLFPTLCAGMYLLRMETVRGAYWTSFIVLR